jgi:hypothetical protein
MRVSRHIAASAALSALVYAGTGSTGATVSSFLAGWVIDTDHLLDYAVEHGPRFDPAFFFATFREDRYRKARVVLHGWEWPLVLALVSWAFGTEMVTAGLAFGWLQHLVFDQITNGARPLGYSLLWRAAHGFDYRASFPASRPRR